MYELLRSHLRPFGNREVCHTHPVDVRAIKVGLSSQNVSSLKIVEMIIAKNVRETHQTDQK